MATLRIEGEQREDRLFEDVSAVTLTLADGTLPPLLFPTLNPEEYQTIRLYIHPWQIAEVKVLDKPYVRIAEVHVRNARPMPVRKQQPSPMNASPPPSPQ